GDAVADRSRCPGTKLATHAASIAPGRVPRDCGASCQQVKEIRMHKLHLGVMTAAVLLALGGCGEEGGMGRSGSTPGGATSPGSSTSPGSPSGSGSSATPGSPSGSGSNGGATGS